VKRHESLIPLSREHHKMLLLAQLLKKDAPAYQGLPLTLKGKWSYAKEMFNKLIIPHFHKEETILFARLQEVGIAIDLIYELKSEHDIILLLFNQITEKAIEEPEIIHKLAILLSSHIRKEERVFFQHIQQEVSESILSKIKFDQ